MSALVSLKSPAAMGQHFRSKLRPEFTLRRLNSKMGVEVTPGLGGPVTAELLSGANAGDDVTRLEPQQRGILRIGTIAPPKFQALICVNPELLQLAQAQSPTICEPREEQDLFITLQAVKAVDLAQFDWFMRIYLAD